MLAPENSFDSGIDDISIPVNESHSSIGLRCSCALRLRRGLISSQRRLNIDLWASEEQTDGFIPPKSQRSPKIGFSLTKITSKRIFFVIKMLEWGRFGQSYLGHPGILTDKEELRWIKTHTHKCVLSFQH